MTPKKKDKDTKKTVKTEKTAAKPKQKKSAPKKASEDKKTKKTSSKSKSNAKPTKPKKKVSRQKRKKIQRTTKIIKPKKESRKKVTTKTVKEKQKTKKSDVFIKGAKEVNLYNLSGKSTKKVKLPIAFDDRFRLDLIKRAVKAARANRRQPYAPSPLSGMQHSSSTWGKGRGTARVQRLVDGRRAVESPNNVGGRRAHPPTMEKVWAQKINKKERHKAKRAALAAITQTDLVAARGHKFDEKITLPLILEDEFENIQKIKNAIKVFQKIGVIDDIARANNGKHIRAGKGKTRGRRYRRPKSVLIVAMNRDELRKGVGNLIGVDVVTPEVLSVEDLAPGGDPGRLTIITESALKAMGSW